MLVAHGGAVDGGVGDEVVMTEGTTKEKKNVMAEKRMRRRLIFGQL